jgi:hypothetical protein
MGADFAVRLEELEQARANLARVLTDVFEDTSSPANPTTLRSNTASDGGTGQMPGDVMRPADAGGSSFGPTGLGVAQISALESAHGKAQAALLALIGELNTQISTVHERVDKTHQAYAATEAQLHVSISRTQEAA